MGSRKSPDRPSVSARPYRNQDSYPPRSSPRLLWRPLRTASLVAMLLWAWAATATTYLYDANGRLVVATNDAGESARYVYDPMGNVQRIDRIAASDLAVFAFSPARGGAGREVRIRGRGFSATASANQVAFNGVAATVLDATATELRAVVPTGASTGPISVSVAGRSASSVQDFVVDENSKAPIVASVAPSSVAVGDSITVSGQNLLPVAGQTSFRINGRPISAETLSDGQATLRVPVGASSGKIAVTTPYGIGVSQQTVLVAPDRIAANSVVDVKDVAIDAGATPFAVGAAQQYTAAIFYANAGDYLTAQFGSITTGVRLRYTLYNIANQALASGTVSTESPSVHLPKLAAAGMHMLLVHPESDAAPASWSVAFERARQLSLDGAALAIDSAIAGQQRRFTFESTTGAAFGLGFADRTTPVAWGSASIYVYSPGGGQLAYQFCDQSRRGCSINLPGLKAGTHTFVVVPSSSGTRLLGMDATLSNDLRGSFVRDSAVALSLTRRGQNARWAFTGNAGEMLALHVAGQVTTPAGAIAYYRVSGPNGATVASTGVAVGATLNLLLPTTGAYELFVDPENGETLNAQMALSAGSSAMQVDGSPGVFETTSPGQGVFATFQAGASQNLGLAISELTVSGGGYVNAIVYKSDGSILTSAACYVANDGCDFNLPNLATGIYGLSVRPGDNTQTMRFKTILSTDASLTLQSGSSVAMNLGRRGQNARLQFVGTIGQVIKLAVSAQQSVPANRTVYYRIQRPDGAFMASMGVLSGKSLTLELPADGSYMVYVDPEFGAEAFSTIALSPGTFGAAVLDGETGRYETTVAGQSVTIEFNASANQFIGFGMTDLTTSNGAMVNANWYKPGSSTSGGSASCKVGEGCDLDINWTVSGNYRVVISPSSSAQTFKFKATLSTAAVGTLTPDTPRTIALERPGQNGRFKFDAVAGQGFGLILSGQTTTPSNNGVLYEIWQDGATQRVTGATVSAAGSYYVPIKKTGTYALWIDPDRGAMPTARVVLTSGKEPLVVLDGASTQVETLVPGEGVYVTVNATGTGMGLALSELVTTAGQQVHFEFQEGPVSLWPVGYTCLPNGIDCAFNLPQGSGQYRFLIRPSSQTQLMKFKLTLSTDVQLSVRRSEPTEIELPRTGQNAYLSFSGQAGERLGLSIAGQTTSPQGAQASYKVIEPDGSTLYVEGGSPTPITGAIKVLDLPATGTYKIFVDPVDGATLKSRLTLLSGTESGLLVDGAAVRYETGLPGQGIYLSASSVDSALKLSIRDLDLSSGARIVIRNWWPNSTSFDSVSCRLVDGGCDVNLPKTASGRWGITFAPDDLEQAMKFTATLTRVAAPAANAAP